MTHFADDPRRGCAPGKVNPDDFFAERGDPGTRRARRACSTCPFKTECRRYALNRGEKYGIWGGVLMSSYPELAAARKGHKSTSELVHELWEQGLNDGDISRALGLDVSSVRGHRLRLGLPALYTKYGRKIPQVAA